MRAGILLCAAASLALGAAFSRPATAAISLDPNAIGKPPINSWTSFNGDYTGQRYSKLTQINQAALLPVLPKPIDPSPV